MLCVKISKKYKVLSSHPKETTAMSRYVYLQTYFPAFSYTHSYRKYIVY